MKQLARAIDINANTRAFSARGRPLRAETCVAAWNHAGPKFACVQNRTASDWASVACCSSFLPDLWFHCNHAHRVRSRVPVADPDETGSRSACPTASPLHTAEKVAELSAPRRQVESSAGTYQGR